MISALIAGLLVLAPPPTGKPIGTTPDDRLVDMVVAEVGGSVVTLSELVAETRLVLLRTRGPDLAWSADLTPPLLAAVLRSIVHRELLLQEVKRLQLRDPDPEDLVRAVNRLQALFATPGDFDRFLERAGFIDVGASTLEPPPALAAILKAEVLAERFLDVRIRLSITTNGSEVVACFDKNRHVFKGRTLDSVRARISNRVREEKETRALAALIEQLEERTQIVYLPPFERTPPEISNDDLEFSCTPS